MKKSELLDSISEKSGLNKKDAETFLTAFTDTVGDAVSEGDTISLPNFGTFSLKERAARKGRNPKTGEEIEIAASKSLGFKQGSKMKEKLN